MEKSFYELTNLSLPISSWCFWRDRFSNQFDKTTAQSPNRSIIKLTVLKKGDKVGMVAPASYSFELEDIKIVKEVIKQYGFKVELGTYITSQYGYLAAKRF